MLFDSVIPARALFDPCLLPLGLFDPDLIAGVRVEVPDVYAYFPGDPYVMGTRYEEYAKEQPKAPKRIRKKKPLPYVAPPLEPLPVEEPLPLDLLVPAPEPVVQPDPRSLFANIEQMGVSRRTSEPIVQAPDWTRYAHLPVDPMEEDDELSVLMHLLNQ